jgi:cytochrome b561
MQPAAPISRYTKTAVVVHWLIAAIVFGQFAFGWLMQQIPKGHGSIRADAFNLHKSIGLCLLSLMLFRLGWRLLHPAPPLPALPRWQACAAKANHAALYATLIVMPLAGYLGSVFSGYPVKWFGMTLPAWGSKMPAVKDLMSEIHLVASFMLLTLVVVHVAAALMHAWRGDGVLARMTLAPAVPRFSEGQPRPKPAKAMREVPARGAVRFPRA